MADRAMTLADLQRMLEHADRAGLVNYVAGIAEAWWPSIDGLTVNETGEAFAHFRNVGPPGESLFVRPFDIRGRALGRRQRTHIPRHLECREHPGHYEYNCEECRKRIMPPNPENVERLKATLRQALEEQRRKRESERKAEKDAARESFERTMREIEAKQANAHKIAKQIDQDAGPTL